MNLFYLWIKMLLHVVSPTFLAIEGDSGRSVKLYVEFETDDPKNQIECRLNTVHTSVRMWHINVNVNNRHTKPKSAETFNSNPGFDFFEEFFHCS